MSSDLPTGKPFSRVYQKPETLLRDSPKFRRRLGAYAWELSDSESAELAKHLKKEYGIKVPSAVYGYEWTDFFEKGPLVEVLDSVTGFFTSFTSRANSSRAAHWLAFVTRVLEEESVGYRLDAKCGVHFRVDDKFERNRVATLSGLGKARYAGARHAFEEGMAALDSTTPKTLLAVRGVFDANETVFKLMLGTKVSRLGSAEVDRHLRPLIARLYDKPAADVASKMVSSFGDWVDGMQIYRHAQGSEEPSPPPLGLAVAIIDSGTAFLRWLIELDARSAEAKA